MLIKPVDTFDYVVFGATGDLTMRKLLPALYYRFRDKQFSERVPHHRHGAVAAGRRRRSARRAAEALDQHVAEGGPGPGGAGARSSRCCTTRRGNATEPGGLDALGQLLECRPRTGSGCSTWRPRPTSTVPTCQNLQAAGLADNGARVVLEKPIGHDLYSARGINDTVGQVFGEAQTFRIDHYLGKETVQNLLALRFANVVFERLWNADVIDHVQITVGETVGVEQRGDYYDRSGALRDMVQNHLLQLALPAGDGAAEQPAARMRCATRS